ncbi:PREDICTED: claudin-7-like, partial [Mesitornis unicolor]|uniref:claudin-7-like n=1 Tax=Mesitornis unicolor TaxID=54374 RepID=UPI000528ABF0
MASGALQTLGLLLALLGWGALLGATALPQWQSSSFGADSIITAVVVHQGLWMTCVTKSTGVQECKTYDSILALG